MQQFRPMQMPVFEYVSGQHAFASDVAKLREVICCDTSVSAALARFANSRPIIHSEIKVTRSSDGDFIFDRFYWSLQFNQPGEAFFAQTLTFDRRSPQAVWQVFPSDRYLPGLATHLQYADGGDVLRYVPFRRFTFKDRTAGAARIGKFKRRSRFQEAYERLRLSASILNSSVCGISVAGPAGISPEHALYYQHMLEGDNVADLLDETTVEHLLYDVGQLHRQMHAIDGCELGIKANTTFLHGALGDIDLIAFHMPHLQADLAELPDQLRRTEPDDSLACFCHGDFVSSQILRSRTTYSVIDFDLCCRADPFREVAMFAASLTYDAPALQLRDEGDEKSRRELLAAAEVAYMEGYGRSLRQVRRLLWHQICAELYYLALSLKKDRFDELNASYRLERIARFSEDLG